MKTLVGTEQICEVEQALQEYEFGADFVRDLRRYGDRLLTFADAIQDKFPAHNYDVDSIDGVVVVLSKEDCNGNCKKCPFAVAIETIFDDEDDNPVIEGE